MKGPKKMMTNPRSFTELTNSNLSQDRWIDLAVEKLIDPMFYTKSTAYSDNSDQFHSIRELARRNFPKEYEANEWYAMAHVVGILVDKHHVALAKTPDVYENRDRAVDCVVYEFFRLRFILLGNELEKSHTLEQIQEKCQMSTLESEKLQGAVVHECSKCNCKGNNRKLSFDYLANKESED